MTAIGLTICSMVTAVRRGTKARLNSRANTIKERKMDAVGTSGLTVVITKATSSTACSKGQEFTTSLSPRGRTRDSSPRTCSKVRESLHSRTVACTKEISEPEKRKGRELWSSRMAISTLASGKTTCSTALVCTIQQKRESKSKVTMQTESVQHGSANPSKWAEPPTELKCIQAAYWNTIFNAD